ncbi:MAG: acyloxyacyl hydrolase [Candidatus Omnitrophica bacterium]|nr:acyloxyacyl hydrolase [Candidatus Omnitrophota bacterium]
MKKPLFCGTLILGILLSSLVGLRAEEMPTRTLKGIEFLVGIGLSKLKAIGSHRFYPLTVDFDFDLKPLARKINFSPAALLEFQIETFLAPVSQPRRNIETGVSFFFKIGALPETARLQPYLKLGVGMDYMTLHTREQSTQYNYTETGAVGAHYFFNQNVALTVEGRFRHLSNSGIKHPNQGINSRFAFLGIAYRF